MTDPAPADRAALWASLAVAAVFTVFALVTTQDHAVRAGSPWQDDPYDGVVSFTVFLVPALAVLTGVRALLLRRGEPQPLFRVAQLLRAARVCTVLVAATAVTDWLAVVLRADRSLWNDGTPWLVATLVPLTLATAAAFGLEWRAFRRLPPWDHRDPGGDWLDDLTALAGVVEPRLPRAVRPPVARLAGGGPSGFVRGHIVAFALAASLATDLPVSAAQALGEHWTSPLLFLTAVAIGTGGFFAFSMICNSVLRIAVRPPAAGRTRRAARAAAVAGALAVPVSAVLRDAVWRALGHDGPVGSPELLAMIVAVGGALTAVLAFGAVLASGGAFRGRRNGAYGR